MDVFTMVAIIVAASCAAGVANNYFKAKGVQDEVENSEGLAAELDELRSRIEVLEKIVTDPKHQLKSELEALENGPAGQ